MAAIISYNMSVFSAMGYHKNTVKSPFTGGKALSNSEKGFYPSEARFLRRAETANQFFNRALKHLADTVTRLRKEAPVIMIGIQEFHPPTLEQFKILGDYIYKPFTKEITNSAKVLTIFDKSLGDVEGEIYEEDLGLTKRADGTYVFNPPAPPMPNDGGRPIMIIKTTKGYTLINFHGPNRPRLPADKAIDVAVLLKEAIQIHAQNADILSRDPSKIIITCDSNDRRHQINSDKPLFIGEERFSDGHKEDDIPISCCYNHDSTGLDTVEEPSPFASMEEKGNEDKYIYSGDYVLAKSFETAVTPVQSPLDKLAEDGITEIGASIASDHKLVYAIIPFTQGGGRRKRKTRNAKLRSKKLKTRSKSKSRR